MRSAEHRVRAAVTLILDAFPWVQVAMWSNGGETGRNRMGEEYVRDREKKDNDVCAEGGKRKR